MTFEFIFFIELKNHQFFKGIDWKKVAKRELKPPFEPNEVEIIQKYSIDLSPLLRIAIDDEFQATINERIHCECADKNSENNWFLYIFTLILILDYLFVAPEHKNWSPSHYDFFHPVIFLFFCKNVRNVNNFHMEFFSWSKSCAWQ